jgi:putative nucleotidyltransferase with HDIG domain
VAAFGNRVGAEGPALMDCLELVATQLGPLPRLRPAAEKLLDRLSRSETTREEIDALLHADADLLERVLETTNSRFLGLGEPLPDVSDAYTLLGPATLRSIVLVAATQPIYRSMGPRLRELMMWEHALGTAMAARLIAVRLCHDDPDRAFVAGLVHDIGKVVLDQNLGDRYVEVLERVYDDRVPFCEAEQDVLGFDHADVGALVARSWRLPEPVADTVRMHHRPMYAEHDPACCAAVSLGSDLCLKLELGPESRPELELIDVDAAWMLGLDADSLSALASALRAKLGSDLWVFGTDLPWVSASILETRPAGPAPFRDSE